MNNSQLRVTGRSHVDSDGDLHVDAYWSGVPLDRPHTFGWNIGPADMRRNVVLADRLMRAVNAGVVFVRPSVTKDNAGQTYVTEDDILVRGKRMNADLNRLGY